MNIFGTRAGSIRWGFSSMGAPELTLAGTLALADSFGMDFVELRALENSLDLPAVLAGRKADVPPARASVLLVASSLRLCHAEEADVADFLRHAALAFRLGAPFVRVFGGGTWGRKLSPEELHHGAETVAACRKQLADRAPGVRMLLETHQAFSSSSACQRLNHLLDEPLEILWDSHHTWRMAMERPEETWGILGPLIRHVHYKDSVHRLDHESRSHYVLPGRGDYPTGPFLDTLGKGRYRGGVSLEWEKLWQPALPSLHQALPAFRDLVRNAELPK